MSTFFKKFMKKEDPKVYQKKDAQLIQALTTKDFIALGVGTIVSATIFTLPGVVAAKYAGPAVTLSFILAAVVAGVVAFAYAEMSSAMPFAGSAFSWINVVFGEGFGWIAGWALLAEYFIAVAFVASGLSSNFRGLIGEINIHLPAQLSNATGVNGGWVDIIAVLVTVFVAFLLSKGVTEAARVENVIVVLKVLAIVVFIIVGATAIKFQNYVPFIPEHKPGTSFGGWQGIYAGVSSIFLSYIGFDSIAANAAEAKNPSKTMPRGILGSLLIAVVLFMGVALVLVGMFKYTSYAGNAEPVGWALRHAGHPVVAAVVQAIAVIGMTTALIGMMLAGSRLLYSFGRDGMLPSWLGKLNKNNLPNNALFVITLGGVALGGFFPFEQLSQLVSAGTLVAFMFVSLGIYPLRKREGKDLPEPGFKMPGYPVMPVIAFLGSLLVFLGLDTEAKVYAICWFIVGLFIYYFYGSKHENIVM